MPRYREDMPLEPPDNYYFHGSECEYDEDDPLFENCRKCEYHEECNHENEIYEKARQDYLLDCYEIERDVSGSRYG